MSGFSLVAIIFLSVILLGIINIAFALKRPRCRKLFALVWQELQEGSICKYCAWFFYDKVWQPPDKGAFKTLQELAPSKYKYERKQDSNRSGFV